MNKIKNFFKDQLEVINRNLTIILIVPSLIGGFWQFLILNLIDTSYLRFFSVTQALSDGLIILLFLTVIYLLYEFTFKLFVITIQKKVHITITIKLILLNLILLFCLIFMITNDLKLYPFLNFAITSISVSVLFTTIYILVKPIFPKIIKFITLDFIFYSLRY